MSVRTRILVAAVTVAASAVAVATVVLFAAPAAPGNSVPTPAVPVAQEVDPRVPRCTSSSQLSCFDGPAAAALSEILAVLDVDGPNAALVALREAVDTAPGWLAQCHDMAHVLGQNVGKAYDPAGLIGIDQRLCLEGFSHGILEGFSLTADDDRFDTTVVELCTAFTPRSWEAENCAHSVGHAVSLRAYEALADAFARCDLLPEELRTSCGTGMVMGIASPTASFDPPDPLDPTELDGLCQSLPERYQRACWTSLWQFYPMSIPADDLLVRLSDICTAAAVTDCFEGLGIAAYFRGLGGDRGDSPETVVDRAMVALETCTTFTGNGFGSSSCANGVGSSAALWWGTLGWSFDSYLSPCERIVDPFVAEACVLGETGQATGADPSAPLFPG